MTDRVQQGIVLAFLGVALIGLTIVAGCRREGGDRSPDSTPAKHAEEMVDAGDVGGTVSSEHPVRELVSFSTSDGGLIYAHDYGDGEHGVVLSHGARFDKGSWGAQARLLAQAGFRALAIDLRGYGQSRGGGDSQGGRGGEHHLDILGAVRYLRDSGATTVSVIGASFGGGAAARASVAAKPGEIDRLVLLAHSPIEHPERMQGRKLFILARGDSDGRRLPGIHEQYERAPEPKELVILEGSAHAQHIFNTDQGERLMHEIQRFLSEP